MTTTTTLPTPIPVLTPAGSRIPKVGTICCHSLLGFGSVISRTQSSVRIVLDDLEGADDVTLKDGTISYADVDPKLLGRVMSAVSPEEFGEIVNAIANAVENPQPKAYCQRVREGDM